MALKRHFGRIKNTDRRCVVVYMQLPGDADHALVIDTDALHPRFHDELMEVVDGEGQREPILANVLSRRVLPFTGQDIFNSLHQYGHLQRVSVDNIMMYPEPNRPISLRQIIDITNGTNTAPAATAPAADPINRQNHFVQNQNVEADEKRFALAQGLLKEASFIEAEAQRKREQAYEMYPALRPASQNYAPAVVQTPAPQYVNDAYAGEAILPEDLGTGVSGVAEPVLGINPADLAALEAQLNSDVHQRALDHLERAAAREQLVESAPTVAEAPAKRGPGRPRKTAG